MEPNVKVLSNNLPVVFVETNMFPSFTALLLVGAGSRFETKENNGIAHFFEHMAFKGSEKYGTSLEISSMIEGLGGVFNAFTDKDHTGYWIKAPTPHFETVIDVISQMILKPKLEEEEISREKGVIIEEMNMYEDTPYRKVGDMFEELLYQGSPLGFDIIGTKETVTSFTRKTFTDYIDSLYKPSNAVLVISGGFKGSRFEKNYMHVLEEKFGEWKDSKTISFDVVKESQNKPQIRIKNKQTEQAHFCLGFRTFSYSDPRRYALSILSAMLGGGMSSRLFIEVRERRGLCYYISTSRELYHDVGNIVTQAGVTNNAEKVNEAIAVTLEQYKSFADGKVTSEEFTRAKEMIKGRIVLSLEDSHSIASFYGTRLLLEKEIISPDELMKRIDVVTLPEVINLAKNIFVPEHLNFTIVGPFKESDIILSF